MFLRANKPKKDWNVDQVLEIFHFMFYEKFIGFYFSVKNSLNINFCLVYFYGKFITCETNEKCFISFKMTLLFLWNNNKCYNNVWDEILLMLIVLNFILYDLYMIFGKNLKMNKKNNERH